MLTRIGEVIRKARELDARSQDALAEQCGIPVAVLVDMERGEGTYTSGQLAEVAEALSIDPIALLHGNLRPLAVPSVFLRHSPMQDFRDDDGATLDEAVGQGRSLVSLRALLRESPLGLQAGSFHPREVATDSPDAPAQDGYRLAQEVRQWLGNVDEPLGDVRAVVEERFGVAVLVRRFQSRNVTAAAVRAGSTAVVVLNALDPARARNPLITRVALAHELCHVLFDPSPGGLHIVVDIDVDRKAKVAEQRANAFAAELLLPRRGLVKLFGDPASMRVPGTAAVFAMITRARSHFGTPHKIAVNQLSNRSFLKSEDRQWFEDASSEFAGTPPVTTLPADGAASLLVGALAERAYQEELLTDGEARATLGVDRLMPLPWDEVKL